MPFTFSHPAAAIPLKALIKRLSLPALIFGSIAPDFEYFFRMKSKYSHTLGGMLWFDLPLTLALLFLFYTVIREPFINALPLPLRARFADILAFDLQTAFRKDWFIIYISAILGSFTHILWDGFTHANGYFVERLPLLNLPVTDGFPIYRLFQYFSTLLGFAVISVFIFKLPEKECSEKATFSYWILSGLIMLPLFLLFNFYIWKGFNSFWHYSIIFLSSFFCAITLAAIIFKAKKVFSTDMKLPHP
ncbi:MAG: DUF4184 family protein [Deferribacteraceae bacterium]|jgi:hypothetical protein|nr:DUF4184 family protein [Deferribacteraceae bacterium]